jgi:hypothetical protein
MLIYPFAQARAVLEGCIDIAASAPHELTFQLGLVAGADTSVKIAQPAETAVSIARMKIFAAADRPTG